ncbi:PRP38-domain-containing protein, partial [Karstenula rhodostoma CBS 690.94]
KADSGNVFDDRGYSGPTVRGGVNPVTLIEKAMRERIIESMYWKEQLFAVNEAMICDRAVTLTHVGGSVNNRPTPFICILLKLLSLVPSEEIILEMLNYEEEEEEGEEPESADSKEAETEKEEQNGETDDRASKEKAGKKGSFKYLRALAAFYVRLTMEPVQVYKTLEPLLLDRRKLKYRKQAGFTLTYLDEFVDNLLTQPRLCGTSLPALPPRSVLEDLDLLDPRESPLADEVEDMDLDEEDARSRGSGGSSRSRSRSRSRGSSWSRDRSSRSRSRSRERSYTRSRSRSRSPRRDADSGSRSQS